jgi:hypothetical protein
MIDRRQDHRHQPRQSIELKEKTSLQFKGQLTADTRYSFTAQFLRGGTICAHHAHAIETMPAALSEGQAAEHRAYVIGAIVQSAAALESEISEITMHGPGHHLGSNGVDAQARDFLSPMAGVIDGEQTLRRYDLVAHLLRKQPYDKGMHPYQPAALLTKLRNELIHYKSKWGTQMERQSLIRQLEDLKFDKPAFISPHSNFFPHQCLSASLAGWSVTTGVAFINSFYAKLEIASPLAPHAENLTVPPPICRK